MKAYQITILTMGLIVSVNGVGHTSIPCDREAKEGHLPFIQKANVDVTLTVKPKDEGCQGVHFKHSADEPSPHVTHTHVESAYHVFGGHKWGEREKLSTVLEENPLFKGDLNALCLEVAPTLLTVVKEGGVWKMGPETYVCDESIEPREQELVVTKASLMAAIRSVRVLLPIDMVLVKIKGGAGYSRDWPYLTNDAVEYLMGLHERVSVLAFNTPSIDRESDKGTGSNHKRVFMGPNKLVVEMATFKRLMRQTYYWVKLNLQESQFPDCAVSHLTAEPYQEVKIRGK